MVFSKREITRWTIALRATQAFLQFSVENVFFCSKLTVRSYAIIIIGQYFLFFSRLEFCKDGNRDMKTWKLFLTLYGWGYVTLAGSKIVKLNNFRVRSKVFFYFFSRNNSSLAGNKLIDVFNLQLLFDTTFAVCLRPASVNNQTSSRCDHITSKNWCYYQTTL